MTQLTNRGRFLCIPDGSSQTVSSDSSPLQSSGNSVSDAPNQYGFFLAQRRNLLFENMQLSVFGAPLLLEWLASFEEFPPRQGASFTIDQCGRETDAKGLNRQEHRRQIRANCMRWNAEAGGIPCRNATGSFI